MSKDAFFDQKKLMPHSANKIIFDVGANAGQTTAKYRKVFPESMLYSFEPFAESFDELCETFAWDQRVKPVQSAVSELSGTQELYVNENAFTHSLLPAMDHQGVQDNRTIQVSVTTVDDFCGEESIEHVDILKMDIQGAELLALRGAKESLDRAAVSLIYTEVLFTPLYQRQAFFFQLCEFLATYRYQLFDIYDLRYTDNGQLAWGDAIFLSPGKKDERCIR